MAATIDGAAIPDYLTGGQYRPDVPRVGVDGRGPIIQSGMMSATWTYSRMSAAGWAWWTSTILGGERSMITTGSNLIYDENMDAITPSAMVIHWPRYGYIDRGEYRDVVIRLTNIVL